MSDLINTTASTSVLNGSSATFPLSISHKNKVTLWICVATSNRAFNTISSMSFNGYACTRAVQSIGAEIWYIKNPTPTLIGATLDLEMSFSGTYDYAISCYEIDETADNPKGESGLDAQATGEPNSPASLSVDVGNIIMDVVAIESNTIEADGDQVEVMNLVSGSNSYGSSYKIADATSEDMGWTRTGTPVNDSWTWCGVENESRTANELKIINS